MPLPAAVQLIEEAGALTPNLFNINTGNPTTDQANLDALVTRMRDRADAWMAGHLGANYGLTSPAYAPVLQEEGQIYLTLEKLTAILKAEKTYGTWYPLNSEDSVAYQTLIDTDWGERAMAALDLWVTAEVAGKGFALPVFLATDGIERAFGQGVEPFEVQLEEELAWARGISNPTIGTVRR
jgi:hypothetical protein